jgi:hypothetical protein
MSKDSQTLAAPPPLVALAAWLIPGAGYWLIGQRTRALAVGITIVILFILGVFIGGIDVVDAPKFSGSPFTLFGMIQKPWFIGQALAGLPGLIGAWLASLSNTPSHARLAEISTLYTAVAGMLNLLAVIDSTFRAVHAAEGTR